jgi:hypothetical protein
MPGHPGALLVLARLKTRERDYAEALRLLDGIDEPNASPEHRIALWMERGRNFDSLDRHGEAFQAFGRSRALAADFYPEKFDPFQAGVRLQQQAAAFRRLRIRTTPTTPEEPVPIFVLGFPRSGTSLVEQILASHPDIAGAGELPTLEKIQHGLARDGEPFPQSFLEMSETAARGQIERARKSYLEGACNAASEGRGKRWIVDKHPFNSERLGLIHLMFPEAPIVRVVRHPLDIALSCYFQNFRAASPWTFAFEHIAAYLSAIDAHVAEMREALPLRYHEIRYEDVVAAPEPAVRALLGFVGADYDPRCLAFHENKRLVRTASYEQVTRKLYASSVGRYRHYLPFIDNAAVACLERVLARGGYTIDGRIGPGGISP